MTNEINLEHNTKLLNAEKAWQFSRGYGVLVGLLESDITRSKLDIPVSFIAGGVKFVMANKALGLELTQLDVIDCIHNAIDKGCHIFCCSKSFRDLQYEKEWEDVIEKAFNSNMVIISHTGNDNRGGGHADYPAGLEGVIAVGACDEVGDRWVQNRWNGTNYGEDLDCVCPAYYYPRSWIWQTIDAGSIACANMCGIVALLKSVKKDLTYHEILDLIAQYSSRSVIGYKDTGFGVPDAFRMVSSIVPVDIETDKLIQRLRVIGLEINSILQELGA